MTERPVECSHCKRPIKFVYKEIVGESTTVTEMCGECPILQQKLHGQPHAGKLEGLPEGESGLCCGNCRTTLESVLTGNPLGCGECYAVFSDIIVSQLIESHRIPAHLQKNLSAKKTQPIHIGKSQNKPATVAPSSRLTALNEALNDALKRENYEQAAWLRDQIKALMEKPNEGKS